MTDLTEGLWSRVQSEWRIRDDTLYLNHGSFGPSPIAVQTARRRWQEQLESQPMDFFVRHFESAWCEARGHLARFVGAPAEDLIFVENATAGMNLVAHNYPLKPGDDVLLTDHEYGAVRKIWQHACNRAGANLRIVPLPCPVEAHAQVVQAVHAALGERTRLLVVSHVTSATALILPVREICERAAMAGVDVCIDGPHAPLHLDLDVHSLACQFYTASCHKWLCAPLGSGFLYVAPTHQALVKPTVISWGRIQPAEPATWDEHFMWTGTRDPSAYFAVPAAIEFFERLGCESARQRIYALADSARQILLDALSGVSLAPPTPDFYGAMAHLRLPPGDAWGLQQRLWERHRIEVPIISWQGQRYVRVSLHLYNEASHVIRLVDALRREL